MILLITTQNIPIRLIKYQLSLLTNYKLKVLHFGTPIKLDDNIDVVCNNTKNYVKIINDLVINLDSEYVTIHTLNTILTDITYNNILKLIITKTDFIYSHSGLEKSVITRDTNINLNNLSKIQSTKYDCLAFTIKTKIFKLLNGFNHNISSWNYMNFELLYRLNKLGYKMERLHNPLYELDSNIYSLNNSMMDRCNDKKIFERIKNIPYEDIFLTSINTLTMLDLGCNGRLGNQLFQYATLYSLSKMSNRRIILYLWDSETDYVKFKLNIFPKLKYQKINKVSTTTTLYEDSFNYSPSIMDKVTSRIEKCVNISGFFQSALYFDAYKNDILDLYVLDEGNIDIVNTLFLKMTKNIKLEIVSIHVRRGDYANFKNYHLILPQTYYQKAISLFTNSFFIVFSDDIEWCKLNLNICNVYFSEGNFDYIDLFLMSKCHHNIIANSSFSWWAAYLNRNINKKIVCPSKWFGELGPKKHDLILDSWVVIDI